MLCGSILLQIKVNKHNAQTACSIIIDQLKDVIEENDKNIKTLMVTLKDEYTIRANMLTYMLDEILLTCGFSLMMLGEKNIDNKYSMDIKVAAKTGDSNAEKKLTDKFKEAL